MTGVGALVIFVFQKLRTSTWFNRARWLLPHSIHNVNTTILPAVLAHSRSNLVSDGIESDAQLVNGSSFVALLRRTVLEYTTMLVDDPAPIAQIGVDITPISANTV